MKLKMVLVGGPRQVGKTTFSKSLIKDERQYLSWDDLQDRAVIKSHKIDTTLKLVVLDEIHKYARWRMLIKGMFDKLDIVVKRSKKIFINSMVSRWYFLSLLSKWFG